MSPLAIATTGVTLVLLAAGCTGGRGSIDPDEDVIFYPGYGWRAQDDSGWNLEVRGQVYEKGLRQKIVAEILDELDVDAEDRTAERITPFVVDAERFEQVPIEVAGMTYEAEPTDADGYFRAQLFLTDEQARSAITDRTEGGQALPIRATARDGREFGARVRLIPREGITVVSDIDDTIKHTNVSDTSEMLENTFLREFEPIDGMPELYRTWRARGAVFQYVSRSPWELYTPLAQFLEHEGFPSGPLHLRKLELTGAGDGGSSKRKQIEQLLTHFPDHTFVLVGDSNEHDAEIYAELAGRFPQRVAWIFVRNVPDSDLEPVRKALDSIDTPSQIFRRPAEIEDLLEARQPDPSRK